MPPVSQDGQLGPFEHGTSIPPGLTAPASAPKKKQNIQDASKEQLMTEVEALEQRLTAQSDELRQTTLQLASAEQRERDRLARILHDDLQQLLLAAKWNLRSVKKQLRTNRPLCEELSHAIQMVDRSIEISRSLSRDLSPPALDSGLLPAIEQLVEHFQDAYGFSVRFSVDGTLPEISNALRDLLFQSIRELLFNAAKHSGQNHAELRLRERQGVIEIVVSDEGVGFDLRELGHTIAKGSGLLGISTRIRRMSGQLNIETAPGAGATFRLLVPWGSPTKETS